jgi:NAD(P)-dependent dehydrogenase (short-subunit alcohol dehydrogenase family)
MHELAGQSAIITGVGGGFGRAIALAIANAGAAVTLTARHSREIEDVQRLIVQDKGRALAFTADVRDTVAAKRIYGLHKTEFGTPNILINSAGLPDPYGPIGVIDPEAWWQAVAVHVLGPVNYITASIDDMRQAHRGCIINICSMDALIVRPNQSAYCVAKAAQLRLSEHVARENAGTGVSVFAVHPGVTMSPAAEQMLQSLDARKWLPEFVQLVESVKAQGGRREDLERCGERCVALATGRFNHLSGTFINFHEFEPSTPAQ